MTEAIKGNWRIREWFPMLDERAQERLRIYHLELLRWTKTINLISPSSAPGADLVHFADSILGVQIILNDLDSVQWGNEVWDIGSGNGFPGAVLAILRPEVGVICLESDERKAVFLKQLALRLELETLGVRRARFETLPAESVRVAVARGFASIGRALSLNVRAFSEGGLFYHFKGPDWVKESGESQGLAVTAWKSQLLKEYQLDLERMPNKEQVWPRRAIVKSTKKI